MHPGRNRRQRNYQERPATSCAWDHLASLRPDELCGRNKKCGGKSLTREVLRQVRYGTYMSKRYFTSITDNSVDSRFLGKFGTITTATKLDPF